MAKLTLSGSTPTKMATTDADADDKNKKTASDNDADDKNGKLKLSVSTAPVVPSADSVKMAGTLLDKHYAGKSGMGYNDTPLNKRVTKLVADHVVPTLVKNKEVADNYYNEQKTKNPEYPGSTASELDTVLGKGEGAKHIEAQKTLNKFHDSFSPKTAPKLASTEQGAKEHAPASFSNVSKSTTEDLYVPDQRLSQSTAMQKTVPKTPVVVPKVLLSKK